MTTALPPSNSTESLRVSQAYHPRALRRLGGRPITSCTFAGVIPKCTAPTASPGSTLLPAGWASPASSSAVGGSSESSLAAVAPAAAYLNPVEPCSPAVHAPTRIPTTSPASLTTGPPLLPGAPLTSSARNPLGVSVALTTPTATDGSRAILVPSGYPQAQIRSPCEGASAANRRVAVPSGTGTATKAISYCSLHIAAWAGICTFAAQKCTRMPAAPFTT